MARAKSFIPSLSLILSLILILNAVTSASRALADGPPHKAEGGRMFTLPAPTPPFGVVEAFASFKVNGAPAYGKEMIWRNDLVMAPANMSARVSLESLGKVTLDRGSVVRFTTIEEEGDQKKPRRKLHIQLMAGGM